MCYRIILNCFQYVNTHCHRHPIPSSILFLHRLDKHWATQHSKHTPTQACQEQFRTRFVPGCIRQMFNFKTNNKGFPCRFFLPIQKDKNLGGMVHTVLIHFIECRLNETRRSRTPEQEGTTKQLAAVAYMLHSSQQTRHPATHKKWPTM